MALDQAMTGTFYGIGVGPGDPELISLKAARLITACPVVVFLSADGRPGLARAIAARHIHAAQIELTIDMPMRVSRSEGQAAYDRAATRVEAHLNAGTDVAFLCEGDPMFFGSFMYMLARLGARFTVEIVPGVPSPMAAAAFAKAPLCARDDALAVIPATLDNVRIDRLLTAADTAVIMKLGRHLPRIKALLADKGLLDSTLYVERAGMEGQRTLPLSALADAAAPYFSLLLVSGASVN
jgi:precorrin-2/cobalt-factor-2 C20-methyltransferase